MEYHYTAVMLKKRKLGETDRLYTFYTLEMGKVQAIGRGVRKPAAKLAGHLETLNRAALTVARTRGLGNIATAVAETCWDASPGDEAMLGRVLETMKTFEQLVDYHEKDTVLYALLLEYLDVVRRFSRAAQPEGTFDMLSQAFLFQTLKRLGYGVVLEHCAVSGEPLGPGERTVFSPDAGGVVLSRFASRAKYVVPLGANAIKLLRLFATQSLTSLTKVIVDQVTLRETERALRRFLHWIQS